jgi:Protein of unknown function (DUF3105)
MATRKEEKERRRAERLAAERREADAARRRLLVGYLVAGLLGAAVVAGIVVALTGGGGGGDGDAGDFPAEAHIQSLSGSTNGVEPDDRTGTTPPAIEQGDLQTAAKEAGCELKLDLPDEGNKHVQAKTVDYRTNPPTSGDHNPVPQADGAYEEMPAPVSFVHSLEHGRIEIQYSPDLPEDDQLAIKGVFDEDPPGMLLFPNPDMPYEVATTAWTQLMGCPTYEGRATLDAIRDFRDMFRGQGPEGQIPIELGG